MAYEYNENHIPNLGHLKGALQRAHGDISGLAGLVLGTLEDMIIQEDITIAATAWTNNADTATRAEGYLYKAEVSVTNLIENANVNITLSVSSLAVAVEAKMCPTVIISAGKVCFYAKSIPASNITGKLDAIQLDE
jgi:hypothetical protein